MRRLLRCDFLASFRHPPSGPQVSPTFSPKEKLNALVLGAALQPRRHLLFAFLLLSRTSLPSPPLQPREDIGPEPSGRSRLDRAAFCSQERPLGDLRFAAGSRRRCPGRREAWPGGLRSWEVWLGGGKGGRVEGSWMRVLLEM